MITFLDLGRYGRLGNQLFQYAILYVVGKENNYEVKIPKQNNMIHHGQKSLLTNFNISAKYLNDNDKVLYSYVEKENENFVYNNNVFKIKDNTNLKGFFQNSLYYIKYQKELSIELSPKKEILEKNKKKLIDLKNKYKNYEIVSLHLRRGDTKLSMYGNNTLDKQSNWYKYFLKAKDEFKHKKVKFLLFTGGRRSIDDSSADYEWVKNNFKGDEYIILNTNRDTINDFALMYLCDHHILSPISTFSWWIGFLNLYKNKKIVAPLKYYFLEKEMPFGFYPNGFILK